MCTCTCCLINAYMYMLFNVYMLLNVYMYLSEFYSLCHMTIPYERVVQAEVLQPVPGLRPAGERHNITEEYYYEI